MNPRRDTGPAGMHWCNIKQQSLTRGDAGSELLTVEACLSHWSPLSSTYRFRQTRFNATMGTGPSKPQQKSPSAEVKPSILKSLCHPLVDRVSKEVDDYFSEHWPFKDDKTRKKFISQGIPRVTCLYCAKALDDRIAFACKLITITFLTDGQSTSL